MSQDKLAKALGYSQSAVAEWEGGKRPVDIDVLRSMARVLAVDVKALIPAEEGEGSAEDPLTERLASMESKLDEILKRLPP